MRKPKQHFVVLVCGLGCVV